MKLIRLTDERYILDLGHEITPEQAEAAKVWWKEWWSTNLERPEAMMIGGSRYPIEYEDRREPDIESRLRAIESRLEDLENR